MEQPKQKLGSLKRPAHFIVYCMSFMLYATAMAGVGPFIPYLADRTGHRQTQYSFLFFWRSAGLFAGSILLKTLQKSLKFHTILFWSSILVCISMALFTFVMDVITQGFIMFFVATFISMINIMVNVCVAETQKGGNVNFWMHVLHATYGIGGLIGPVIIYIFELNSYLILGILIVVMVPFYFKLESPQVANKNFKQLINPTYCEFQSYEQSSPTKPMKRKYIGQSSQELLCVIFWTYIGIELGFGNWISSYAVLENVASKEQALKYNSIFWIAMTVFRILSSYMPFKSMKKILIHEYSLMVFVTLSVLFVFFNQLDIACIVSSITYGMCFSAMYPLLLSIPLDYNLEISSAQMTNIALWSALGEATLALCFGLFMEWFNHNMIFYITFVMVIVLIFMTHYLQQLYGKDSKKGEGIELKEFLKTNN